MFRDVCAFSAILYVPHVFFSPSSKGSLSFANVVPRARCAWNFIDDIALVAVASFHDSLNSIDQHISFTIEHESNGQLPFLDTLISRDNGKLMVDIYPNPHIQIDILTSIHTMTESKKSAPLRHFCTEL